MRWPSRQAGSVDAVPEPNEAGPDRPMCGGMGCLGMVGKSAAAIIWLDDPGHDLADELDRVLVDSQALRSGVVAWLRRLALDDLVLLESVVGQPAECDRVHAVSYTHLTLPTNREEK